VEQFKNSSPLQKFTLEEPQLTPTLADVDYFALCTIFNFPIVNYIHVHIELSRTSEMQWTLVPLNTRPDMLCGYENLMEGTTFQPQT
jgi:hypothetical protein